LNNKKQDEGDGFSIHSERRRNQDRRTRKITALMCSFFRGRRQNPQRKDEKNQPFYTDVYGPDMLLLMLLILSLCVADAGLTILILQKGGVELNPFMVWLLESSSHTFFTAKYILTSLCLTVVLLHINFKLFNRITMQYVLVAVLGGYTLLVGYELKLLAI